jgi:hypothetical protein
LFLESDSSGSTTTDDEEAAATLPQPPPPSAATAADAATADAAAVDFVNDSNIFAAEEGKKQEGVEEFQEDEVEEEVFFESHEDEVEDEPGGGISSRRHHRTGGGRGGAGGGYPPGDIIEQEGVEESREDEVEEEQVADHIILNRKGRLALDEIELYTHFANRLSGIICPNKNCDCLDILQNDENALSSVAMYLSWFERRSQYDQNSIYFEWWRYVLILRPSTAQRKGSKNKTVFRLPYFVGDCDDGNVSNEVKSHLVCRRGLNTLLNFGMTRYMNIRKAALSSAVLPPHKRIGTVAAHSTKNNERKYQPLVRHFEYIKNLGEVRATELLRRW